MVGKRGGPPGGAGGALLDVLRVEERLCGFAGKGESVQWVRAPGGLGTAW
jgi:hypothetical protein